jgi:NADH-quinone oxidoreductase subunit C
VTISQSETSTDFGEQVAAAVSGRVADATDTIKVVVEPATWVETLRTAKNDLGLIFFSWLGAVDWTNEPVVGEPVESEVDERFEVLCTVGDISAGRRVTFSTSLAKSEPRLDSLVGVYAGANWHERETHEMFGIEFVGHPNLAHLYLPDGFIGQPLLKSYPLLSRDVKPWPGTVDVEGMPGVADEEPAEGSDE